VAGLRPYGPGLLPAERWEAWFGDPASFIADRRTAIAERHKFSILVDYLRAVATDESDILDVGCGDGRLRAWADGIPFRSWRGVDPTPSAIRQARRLEDDRTSFVLQDPNSEELEPADIVVCAEVLYHVPDHRQLTARLVELCREPGHVIVSNWRHPGDTLVWRELDRRLVRIDTVDIRAAGYAPAPRGWRVALYHKVVPGTR
jgi:2-polyprenyl-3-methyl-5-hydroxy-6-metoxy-1,4-benzoquinol methylase